jgi:predicted metal-dependent hydrolase
MMRNQCLQGIICADTINWQEQTAMREMAWFEDDRPRATPEYLKGLTTEQLRERAEKLIKEYENKPVINPRALKA